MANYWPGFWTDVRGAILSAWSDITADFRAVQMERLNWYNLLNTSRESGGLKGLTPPWCVIEYDVQQDDWGLQNEVFRVTLTVYYIGSPTGTDYAATLEGKVKALEDIVRNPAATFTTMQVLNEGMVVDVTEHSPANQTFLQQAMPYMAGSLTFQALVGEVIA